MLKRNSTILMMIGLLYAFPQLLFAQSSYTKLLYHVPLTSESVNPIGAITSTAGEYTSKGWTAKGTNGQLRIDLDGFLPFEGMMEVSISGLMPTVTDEWIPFALYSRGDGNFDKVDPTPGSYTFIKTDERYSGNNLDFKFFAAAFYGANGSNRQDFPIYKRTWNTSTVYKFYVIWNRSTIKLMLNNETLGERKFEKQMESFGYIFLGRDNTYNTTMQKVYYRDLKIYVSDTDTPFLNIADAYNEMADKKIGGQGAALADVDKNGEEDLYVTRFYGAGGDWPNLLYMQANDAFVEEGTARGVSDPAFSYQPLFADFDKDGDVDLFVNNFSRSPDYTNQPNHLYLNDGNGNFTDATVNLSGNTEADARSATLIDIENDGDMDVVVLGETAAHKVFVNSGNAQFSAQTRGLENFRSSANKYQSVAAGDLNGDGSADLVLLHQSGIQIARNNGSGTFVTGPVITLPATAAAVTLADIDNDADLDILSANSGTDNPRVEIMRNDGNLSFTSISGNSSIGVSTFSILPGDWNNDGKVDIFLIDRNSTGRLYLNEGAGRFTEKTKTGVDAVFADGRGSVTLDVNQDGRLDIYATARGGTAVDDKTKEEKPYGRNYLFRNDVINGKNYLRVRILDANEGVAGIGAKIYVYRQGSMDNASALLGYREVLSANGYKSQSSLIQHFGLDAASSVDVKVVFPDRTEQRFTNVTANQVFTVRAKRIDAAKLVRDFSTAQQAIASEAYEIAYKTLAADNTPVPGFPVTFTIKSGNGSFSSTSSVTTKSVDADQNGRARIDWYLGPLAGANQIEAAAVNNGTPLSGSPDGYQVVSSAGAPFSIVKSAGDAQIGFVNEQLPLAITAKVTDKNGNAIANHPVEFTISSGDGKLKNGSSLTTQLVVNSDGNGNAAAVWVLGSVIGQQSVYARSTYSGNALQNSPLTFTATAQRPLRKLSYISGDRQTAQINTLLADPLRVRLLDTDNVPITGESIVFKSLTAGAKFSGSDSLTVSTDSQGYAGARPSLGSVAGDTLYIFEARARNASGSPVTFKASAITGPPTKIIYVSGNNQSGPTGRVLPQTLRVRLLDNLDNPVKGYDVQYNVTEGGGSFNRQQNQLIKSDAQGYAEARWRLGERTGKNTATATAVNTSLPQITFSATGVVGPAARLIKNGGDNQKGNAGQPLGQYFVVSVTDSFYNTVSNHSVSFQVIQGGGTINGRSQVTQTTSPFGQAQVLYTMGPIDYEQKVQATAELNGLSLIDSPQVFRAVLGPGEPESMLYISGNNQIGRVNEELPEPFIVQIVDKNGIGVPNHEVEFVTFSQGAAFAGETSIKVRSNTDGFAQATATIGSVYGTNNYAFEAISRYNSKSLKNSPFQFFASGRKSTAKKMLKVQGEITYTGTVGQFLADSLMVLVLDAQDQPVPAHPVTFSAAQGVIFIEGQRTSYETLSDEHGIARVAVKLATTPGNAVIRASSDDGVNPLSPAILDFQIIALVGAADASMSSITATNNVLANGQNLSNVLVKLRDRFNNPIVNQYVTLQTAGIEVFVNQPTLPTDAGGSTTATISSINIGKVMIYALVNNQPVVSTEVEFVAGLPQIVTVLNNGQTYEKGKTLPNKVGVFIQDGWIHPVKNTEVQFYVTRGQGSIAEPQPVLTAEDGRAFVTWTLGDSLGEQKLTARVKGMSQSVTITAYALPPSEGYVRVLTGDSLITLANQRLSEPFVVQVTDREGKPITNFPVVFNIVQGQGVWQTPSTAQTNQKGEAQALLKSGAQLGIHRITATAGNYGTVFFTLIVQEKRTLFISKLSQDGRQVRPKTELAVSVRVLDAFERPVANESINMTTAEGQGYVKETMPLKSNANGLVAATWVVGTSGTQQIEIKAANASHAALFYTAFVINSAPVFSPPLQKNRTVEAGTALQFAVKGTDPDGDTVSYIARHLPENSAFATDTQIFTWTPLPSQEGDHQVTFVIMDTFGAADSSTVKISVMVSNQPPQLLSYSPVDTILTVSFNSPVMFEVQAMDPNGDQLTYSWLVRTSREDFFAGDSYILPLAFTKQAFPDSFAQVIVTVFDGKDETALTWYVHMRKNTAVELVNFAASVRGNQVEIYWKTAVEKGTAGFDILRSRRKEGPFEVITPQIIASQPSGEYRFTDDQVNAGERWMYKLRETDVYGMTAEHGLVEVEIALPKEIALRQNYPNPFNPTTTIRFELPAAHQLQIVIFNMNGQQIRSLVNGEFAAGIHHVVWDAKTDEGSPAPSGIYYYRMTTEGFSEIRKLMLLK